MNKKFNKSLIFVILALVLAFVMVGCDCSGGSGGFLTIGSDGKYSAQLQDVYNVEFGESISLPKVKYNGESATASVRGPNGESVTTQYGLLRPTVVGDYTVTYSASGKTKSITVKCQDTIAPVISIQNYVADGAIGETVTMPNYTLSDKADIDYSLTNAKVTSPSGQTVQVSGNAFELSERGVYVVTITAYDNHGLSTVRTLNIRSAIEWIDTEIADDNILMDFNEAGTENGQGYTDLVFDVMYQTEATREFVTTGYPAANTELEDGNTIGATDGVMVVYDPNSVSNTMQDIYTKFRLHTGFNLGDVKASAIKIRFAFSTDTDYVHFMRDSFICQRFNLIGGLKANTWYEMIVDPLQWGYYNELTNFTIKFRDKGQTKMYIDEISWVDPVFVDENLEAGSLGDFDEEGYEDIAFQNVYNDPTTSRSYCVDGTTFEWLDSGYPEANPADATINPGLGATGGVLKATTSYDFGGMTYMFPELLNIKDLATLSLKMYFDDPMPISYIFGFFNEKGIHMSNTIWYTGEDFHANAPIVKDQWMTINFTGEFLAMYTDTDYVAGFFVQAMVERGYDSTTNLDRCQCVFYLDEITYTNKVDAANSEAEPGSVVTKFATDATMANVIQPNIRKLGHLGTATHQRVTDNVYGATDGVLKITSNYRKYTDLTPGMNPDQALGDGAIYLFDQSLRAEDITQVILKYAVPEGHQIDSIQFALVCSRSNYLMPLQTILGAQLTPGEWLTFGYTQEDQAAQVGNLQVEGVAIIIKTTADDADNVVYLDEITLYESDDDTVAPVGEFYAYDINIVEGSEIGTEFIKAIITDDKDPNPIFELMAVYGPDGEEVPSFGGYFSPEVSGEYTYVLRCSDYAGNESEEYSVSANITVSERGSYDYSNFGPSSLLWVEDYEDESGNNFVEPTKSIVIDDDAADNFALELTTNLRGEAGVSGVNVPVGGNKLIADIHQIEIRLNVLENSGGNWLKFTLNNLADEKLEQGALQNGVAAVNSDSVKGAYYTYIIDAEKIQSALADDADFGSDTLNSIGIVANDSMSYLRVRIDYVKVSFAGEDAEVTFNYDGGIDEDGETSYTGPYANGELISWMPTIEKDGYVFLGWTKDVDSYVLFDAATETVSGSMTLTAVWFDLDWYTFSDKDSAWIVQHKHVNTAYSKDCWDTSSQAATWADDGYATGKLILDGGPEKENHSWVEVSMPNLTVSDLSYLSAKLYSYKNATIGINFNEKGTYAGGNWSGAKKFAVKEGVNNIVIPLNDLTAAGITTLSKLFLLADDNNDPVVHLDGVYFIGAGSPMALYTEEYYLEREDGSYVKAKDLVNTMVGTIDGTATARAIDITGYTFDAANANNVLSGTISADGSLVLKRYYTANTVNITYNYGGASDGTDKTELVVPHKYNGTFVGPDLTLAGKTLVGWTLDTTTNEIIFDRITAEVTVYPVWIDSDLGAYNFADSESDIVLEHVSEDFSFVTSNPGATAAEWAEDGFATGKMTVTGDPSAVDHSYIVIALPRLKTTEIERFEIKLYNDTQRNIYVNFNERGEWLGAPSYTYENAYCATNLGVGVQTIVLDGALFTEAKYGEYVNSVYISSHWTTGTIQVDAVGFKSGTVSNIATYTEKVYLQQADNTYVEATDLATTTWGKVGATVNAAKAAVGGYEYNADHAETVDSGIVAADSGLVLKSYYNRVSSTVTFDYNGGTVGTETSATATLAGGDSLSGIATPTSTQGVFAGWVTEIGSTDYVTEHNGATTYYAAWYDLSKLDFATAEDIAATTAILRTNGVESTGEASVKSSDLAIDGKVALFRIWNNPTHSKDYHGVRIDLPVLNISELTSITIRYYINNDNNTASGGAVYLRANVAGTANDASNSIMLAAPAFGTIAEKVITAAELQAIIGTDTTLNSLYLQGVNYGDNYVHVDYIAIDSTNAEVSAFNAANYGAYVVKHYVQNAQSEYVVDEKATATFARVKAGAEVSATARNDLAGTFDQDNVNNVLTGTIVAGQTIELKLYYNVGEISVVYDYNGGTDGTAGTKTITQLNSDALISGEGITKEGYFFYGWATSKDATIEDVDTDGIVGADTTFYAVWYDLAMLDFATDDNVAAVSAILTKSGESTTESTASDGTLAGDGKVALFRIWNNPNHNDYRGARINLPHLNMSELTSITIRYYIANYDNNAAGSAVYLVPNTAATTEDYNAIALAAPAFGTVAEKVITAAELQALMGTDTVLNSLYIQGKQWQDNYVRIDYISIQSTNADVSAWYAANYGAYTVEHYVMNAQGEHVLNTAATETYDRVKVGTAVTAVPRNDLAGVYNADNQYNVVSGTITAGQTLTLKLYYDVADVSVVYDYNGGTDGTAGTKTLTQRNSDALISGEGITKDGYVFHGWATSDSATIEDVDTDGIVGADTTFYAVWYDLNWLSDMSAAYEAGVFGSGGKASNYATLENGRVKLRTNHPPAGGSYTYGIINLPKLDMDNLVSITLNITAGAGVDYGVFVNEVSYTSSAPKTLAISQMMTAGTAVDFVLTKEALANVTTTGDTVHTLYLGLYKDWNDTYCYVNSITIRSTQPGFPKEAITVTYNLNGGQDAEGNTIVTSECELGDPIMDGSALVREGYTFYGWATNPNGATTYDEMLAAGELADNGTVGAVDTYYAVWYGNDWLEFNDSTVNSLIVNGSYTSTYTGTPVDTELNMAGGRLQDSFKSRGQHFQILLPRVAIADIASIECKAYAYSFTWDAPYVASFASTSSRWFGVAINGLFTKTDSTTDAGGDNTNAFWAAASAGVFSASADAAKVATLMQSEHVTAGTTYLKFLDMASSQNGDQMLMFDYIRITKNA